MVVPEQSSDTFYWIWFLFGCFWMPFFVYLAIPKVKTVYQQKKFSLWFTDSTITHKAGELLIWIPFYMIVYFAASGNDIYAISWLQHGNWVMILGGIVCMYAFFEALNKHWWAWFMWPFAAWGIFGKWILLHWILPYI